jgi:putative endonuclease
MALHNELGKWGEDLACEKLIADGCAIMERNWRMGHYELDIVAMKDDRVIFAEVKTRSDYNCDPLEAVDKKKIARIVASANTYAIAGTPDCYKLEHIPDAFLAPLKTY